MRGTYPGKSTHATLDTGERRWNEVTDLETPHDSLRFAVLGELGREPLTAEQIRERVACRTGTEPSINTIRRTMRVCVAGGLARVVPIVGWQGRPNGGRPPVAWAEVPWE